MWAASLTTHLCGWFCHFCINFVIMKNEQLKCGLVLGIRYFFCGFDSMTNAFIFMFSVQVEVDIVVCILPVSTDQHRLVNILRKNFTSFPLDYLFHILRKIIFYFLLNSIFISILGKQTVHIRKYYSFSVWMEY